MLFAPNFLINQKDKFVIIEDNTSFVDGFIFKRKLKFSSELFDSIPETFILNILFITYL